jgi:probable addiction module antidote protein
MNKRIKVADLPEFDAAHYLNSESAIAAYLTDILEANDAALLASALGDIARARGMTEIAQTAGITREALYKALRPGSAPRFDTVNRVCGALGVRLVVQARPASGKVREKIKPAKRTRAAATGRSL